MNASPPRPRAAAYADALAHAAHGALRGARLRLASAGWPRERSVLSLSCMDGPRATGLFSEFMAVLGALDHYERWPGSYAGLRVDFGLRGLYADPAAGPNWWEHYFAPVTLGAAGPARPVDLHLYRDFAESGEGLPRARAAQLIRRYIRPAPRLERIADAFAEAHFVAATVIGIHYRGTDKAAEVPRVSYAAADAALRDALRDAAGGDYRVFVATDERAFVDFLRVRHPGKVVCRDIFRSADGKPVHHVHPQGNLRKGEDAVVDCLLLARCGRLVRTASTLGLAATFFNPDLPVEALSEEAPGGRVRAALKRAAGSAGAWATRAADGAGLAWRRFAASAGLPARRPFLLMGGRGDGLFSEFTAVLGLLDHYERWRPAYAGLRVDFADRGRYFDPAHGPNWWNYHFEPVELGTAGAGAAHPVSGREHDAFSIRGESLPRRRAAGLVARYLRPRPHVAAQAEAFAAAQFAGHRIVAVHYRGTDKAEEAPRVPYDRVADAVRAALARLPDGEGRIFVATDEAAFLDYLRGTFPDVVSRPALRSTDGSPLHERAEEARRRGEEAVVDCLLLARADALVRTPSNLGLCATFFNPELPVTELRGEA